MTNRTCALQSSNFVNHLHDYRQNWTPLGTITIIYQSLFPLCSKPRCLMYPIMVTDLKMALRKPSKGQKLPYGIRLKIALHTARGLHYLHTEVKNERFVRFVLCCFIIFIYTSLLMFNGNCYDFINNKNNNNNNVYLFMLVMAVKILIIIILWLKNFNICNSDINNVNSY